MKQRTAHVQARPSHRADVMTVARSTALLMAMLVVLAGALLAAPGSARAASSAPPGSAWVRVGHFVPGMGTASITLQRSDGGGTQLMTPRQGVGYGQVSTYDKFSPGTYTVAVRQTSAPADSAPMLSDSVRLASGEARTIAVVGTAKAPRLVVLSDDLTPPRAGSSRVRVIAATGANAEPVNIKAVRGPTVAKQIVLGQTTGYTTVPSGPWTLKLGMGGGYMNAMAQKVSLAAGSVYTVVVLRDGADSNRLDLVTDAAGATKMPQGGAHTGGGGTAVDRTQLTASATSDHGADVRAGYGAGALVLLALAGSGLLIRRRRASSLRP